MWSRQQPLLVVACKVCVPPVGHSVDFVGHTPLLSGVGGVLPGILRSVAHTKTVPSSSVARQNDPSWQQPPHSAVDQGEKKLVESAKPSAPSGMCHSTCLFDSPVGQSWAHGLMYSQDPFSSGRVGVVERARRRVDGTA